MTRKSPESSATLYGVGTKKRGLDGNMWIVASTVNKVKRWKLVSGSKSSSKVKSKSSSKAQSKVQSKVKSKAQSKSSSKAKSKSSSKAKTKIPNTFIKAGTVKMRIYLVHDNGSLPFTVLVDKLGIRIYKYWRTQNKSNGKLVLFIRNYIGYWYGFDTNKTHAHGNSILIQETKSSYILVSRQVEYFKTKEEILNYVSPLGNSDVPYPLAVSENYLYFFTDNKYVKKSDFTIDTHISNSDNLYGEYYKNFNKDLPKKYSFIDKKILVKSPQ